MTRSRCAGRGRLMPGQVTTLRRLDGPQVRQIRKALGLEQSQFAEVCGVTRVTVSRWETGAQRLAGPNLDVVHALAASHGVSIVLDK